MTFPTAHKLPWGMASQHQCRHWIDQLCAAPRASYARLFFSRIKRPAFVMLLNCFKLCLHIGHPSNQQIIAHPPQPITATQPGTGKSGSLFSLHPISIPLTFGALPVILDHQIYLHQEGNAHACPNKNRSPEVPNKRCYKRFNHLYSPRSRVSPSRL